MSTAPFRDVVTLYHKVGVTTVSRTIPVVRCLVTNAVPPEKSKAVVYIPLYGKRSIQYLPHEQFVQMPDKSFTVQAGDKFVCRARSGSEPNDCFVVSSVTVNNHGSTRLRHIKIIGSIPPVEEEEEDPDAEDEDDT